MAYEGSITIVDLMDGQPGADGSSVSKATILYWLKTNSTIPEAPSSPRSKPWEDTADAPNRWTKIIPSYIANGEYYVCLESEITDDNEEKSYIYGDAVKDNGLTDSNFNSVEANSIAQSAEENAQGAMSISRATQQHFWFNSVTSGGIDAGAYITDTPIDSFKSGKSGGYLLARSDGLELGQAATKFMTLNTTALQFFGSNQTYPLMKLSGTELVFYKSGSANVGAKLTSSGLGILDGSITLGAAATDTSSTANGSIALTNSTFTRKINNTFRTLQMAIGGNFGVGADGKLYATGADISGKITVGAGSNAYISENITSSTSDKNLNNYKTTGIYHCATSMTNAPMTNNGTVVVDFSVGTPFQEYYPDNQNYYYKRTYSSSTWSDWTKIDAVGAMAIANDAAPKTSAIAREQRIYWRATSASGKPGVNKTWLATSGTGYGNWSLSIPQLTSGTTKYPFLYTAVQTQTIAQQAAGSACTCSEVLLDDTTTVIDGGKIITGSITANQLDANSVTADKIAAGAITIGKLRCCQVGQSTSTTTNPWYKFASISITRQYGDEAIIFDVVSAGGYGQYTNMGQLKAHIRTGVGIIFDNAQLQWLTKSTGIALSNFVLAYKATNGTKVDVELWAKCDKAYSGYQFTVTYEGQRESIATTPHWTLYNTWTAGSQSAITSEYTQIVSTYTDSAQETATTYITDIDSNKGITIKPINKNRNDYLQINSSAIDFFHNGNSQLSLQDSWIAIGNQDSTRITMHARNDNPYIYMNANGHDAFRLDSNGVHIYDTNSKERALVNANGLTIKNASGNTVATYGDVATLYDKGSMRVAITTNGMDIFGSDGATSVASFGASSIIGPEASPHIHIKNTSMEFYKGAESDSQNLYCKLEYGTTYLGSGPIYKMVQDSGSTIPYSATMQPGAFVTNGPMYGTISSFNALTTDGLFLGDDNLIKGSTESGYAITSVNNIEFQSSFPESSNHDNWVAVTTESDFISKTVKFGFGAGGNNHGIWSGPAKEWLIYMSGSNRVVSQKIYDYNSGASANVHISSNGVLSWTGGSSRRYKKDIEDIKNDNINPEKLYDVRVVQFKYRDDHLGQDSNRYNQTLPGFIVEELEKTYPIAVEYNEDLQPEDWDIRYIVPPMLKLIQDQKKKLDELEAHIEALERR